MNDTGSFLSTITPDDIATSALLIVKVLFIIAFVVYTLFAFVLVREMAIKRQTVDTPLGSRLSLIAITHFILSIALLIVSLVIL